MSLPAPADARHAFADLIGDSVLQAMGLKESLTAERAALEARDSEALDAAIDAKNLCVDRLQALEARRGELCAAAGFGRDPEHMEAIIAWCDEDARVNNAWQQLMTIAGECNDLNLSNGAILRLRQQHTDSALAVLRGADRDAGTYGRTGSEATGRNQHSLAEV